MRWLVTGAGGMLGRDVMSLLAGENATGLTRAELDVTDEASVDRAVAGSDVVLNMAAWTDVDAAESHESEATRVNGDGPGLLAAACARHGARLVQISTDYVFDGLATEPYSEAATMSPRSAYGRSKAAGERVVRDLLPAASYVVRTGWLYGEHGPNFVRTMLRLERERDTVAVVDDQQGQPTWSRDVAVQVQRLVLSGAPPGTYHATSSGRTTWWGLARAVFEAIGADPERVHRMTSDAVRRAAARPAFSVLGHGAWAEVGIDPIRDWRAALSEAIPRLQSSSTPG